MSANFVTVECLGGPADGEVVLFQILCEGIVAGRIPYARRYPHGTAQALYCLDVDRLVYKFEGIEIGES